MTKKIFGTKQITHLIYGILMLLPFLSILSTCAYVAINKNAKDSYYGDTINQEQISNVGYDNLINYTTYTFNNSILGSIDSTDSVITTFMVENVVDNFGNIGADVSTTNRILFYLNSQKNPRISFYVDNTSLATIVPNTNTYNFNFDLLSIRDQQLNEWLNDFDLFYQTSYNKYSFLDNAFDYSIDKFISDNDNYNIHFFDWFGNLFLKNGNTGVNAIYLNFINWYLNYALLVSVGYILFLLMLWFINFVRKILEGGNSFGHGGF